MDTAQSPFPVLPSQTLNLMPTAMPVKDQGRLSGQKKSVNDKTSLKCLNHFFPVSEKQATIGLGCGVNFLVGVNRT